MHRRMKTAHQLEPTLIEIATKKKRSLIVADTSAADLTLHPDFGYWVSLKTEFRTNAMKQGYLYTMERAQALRDLHRRG